jgi:hypothetical protein
LEAASENTPKRKRGRPRHFPESEMQFARKLHQPEKRSGRGLQNFIYQARAQGVIESLLPTYPELRWLYDPKAIRRGKSAFHQTIMQELGRIPDDAVLVRRARDMCNLRPTSREAVKLLRRARLQQGAKGSVEELTEVLRSAVNNYLRWHPDLTLADARAAVGQLWQLIDDQLES